MIEIFLVIGYFVVGILTLFLMVYFHAKALSNRYNKDQIYEIIVNGNDEYRSIWIVILIAIFCWPFLLISFMVHIIKNIDKK